MVVLESAECGRSAECALHKGAAAGPNESAVISRYLLNSIDLLVAASQPSMLVLSEIFYPGWHAYVDGAAANVLRADWNLRAVPVPAGSHQVELRFEPTPLYRGAVVTAITLLIALGLMIWPVATRTRLRLQRPP
jgi:hypothetical protein